MALNQVWFSNRRAKWRRHQRMNLLKQSSPGPQNNQSSMYGGRLTPSPHCIAGSTPGSPLTTQHRATVPTTSSSLLLQMGGENSAFKALVPNSAALLAAATHDMHRLSAYMSDSDEEINVNDESDIEDHQRPGRSRSSSPVEVVDLPQRDPNTCQPLQLTMHDRD